MMSTKVIHINWAPLGWHHNQDYVYIGRAGHGLDGYFGNPIKLEGGTRGSTLKRYRSYLDNRLVEDDTFYRRVKDLKGKTLVCFCKPKPCHGDILIEYIERL